MTFVASDLDFHVEFLHRSTRQDMFSSLVVAVLQQELSFRRNSGKFDGLLFSSELLSHSAFRDCCLTSQASVILSSVLEKFSTYVAADLPIPTKVTVAVSITALAKF